jgi:hypothetical protein
MARACAEYASGPEVGTCARAWHPWLVEEYPPEGSTRRASGEPAAAS